MNFSRWDTAAFIASADCSTSATISSLALKSRPTSRMPSIRGPLMISSGVFPPARTASRSSIRPSFDPSRMYRGRRSIGVPGRAAACLGCEPLALKWAANAATGSWPRFQIRSSASRRSSSEIDG